MTNIVTAGVLWCIYCIMHTNGTTLHCVLLYVISALALLAAANSTCWQAQQCRSVMVTPVPSPNALSGGGVTSGYCHR